MKRALRRRVQGRHCKVGLLESLEQRSLLSVSLLNSELTVTGTSGNDEVTIMLDVAGTTIQVWEGGQSLQDAPSFTAATGGVNAIQVVGSGGNDRLTIDSSRGLINAASGIHFDGGAGFDDLVLTQTGGRVRASTTYTVGPSVTQGRHTISDGGQTQTVFFDNLEPVLDTVASANLTVNGTNASNAITYTQGSVGANGLVTIDEFESIEFSNKGSLTINGLGGDDVFSLNNPDAPAGLTGNIVVNGSSPSASDTLILNGVGGSLDNLRYLPAAAGSGTVINDNAPLPDVIFTGVEHLTIVMQANEGDGVRIEGTIGNDAIEYVTGPVAGAGTFRGFMDQNNSTGAGPFAMTEMSYAGNSPIANDLDVNFFNPGGSDTLALNGTSADEVFTVGTGSAGGLALQSTINGVLTVNLEVFNLTSATIRGGDGDDVFNVNSNFPVLTGGLRIEGGNPSASDSITYIGTSVASRAVIVNLLLGTIQEATASTVRFTGVEHLTVTAGIGDLSVVGTTGDDEATFLFDGVGPAMRVESGPVTMEGTATGTMGIDAGTGYDTVNYNGFSPVGQDQSRLAPTAAGAGTITNGSRPTVNIAGVEHLVVTHEGGSDAFTVDGTTGNDDYRFTFGLERGRQHIEGVMNNGLFALPSIDVFHNSIALIGTMNFNNVGGADSLLVLGTDAGDTFNILNANATSGSVAHFVNGVSTGFMGFANIGTVMVDGLGGDDRFQAAAGGTFSVAMSGGDSGSDELVLTGSGNPANTITADLTARTLQETGLGVRLFTGIENVTVIADTKALSVIGTDGDDVVTFSPDSLAVPTMRVQNARGTFVGTTTGDMTVDTRAGQDTVYYSGFSAVSQEQTRLAPTATGAGSITNSSQLTVHFAGVEHLVVTNDGLSDAFTVDGTTGNDNYQVTLGLVRGQLHIEGVMNNATVVLPSIDVYHNSQSLIGTMNFNNAGGTDTLVILGTGLSDTFNINHASASAGSVSHLIGGVQTGFVGFANMSTVTVDGQDGDDRFNVPARASFGLAVNGGNPSASDELVFTSTGDDLHTVTADLTAGTIQESGLPAQTFTGIEHVTVNAGASALTVVGTAGGEATFITTDGASGLAVRTEAVSVTLEGTTTGLLTVNSGGGTDSIDYLGTTGADAFTFAGSGSSTGVLELAGRPNAAYSGTERIALHGDDGDDTFNLAGDVGAVSIEGGSGADRTSFAGAAEAVVFDLDLVSAAQRVTSTSATVTLLDQFENFTGTSFNDLLRIAAAPFARSVNGGPNGVTPPGDTLVFNGQGRVVQVTKIDFNTGIISTQSYADAAYDEFETIKLENTPSNAFGANAFDTAHRYKIGSNPKSGRGPEAVAAGDLNGDGFADMVVVNTKTKNLGVLINKGDGTFFDPVNIASGGSGVRDIVIGDFDGVAGLDVVVTNTSSKNVAFLHGNDDGTFSAPVTSSTPGFKPYAIAAGFMDGDADLDLVVTSVANASVQVLLGNGGGGFSTTTQVKTKGGGPVDVVLADFDLDGNLDVATANTSSKKASFFAGSAGGVLSAAENFAVGNTPSALAAGDLDGDGAPDLAVANRQSGYLSVLRSVGAAPGAQFNAQLRVVVPGLHRTESIVIADFNGDGTGDLGLGNSVGSTFTVLLGTGQAAFTLPFEFSLGSQPGVRITRGLAVVDVNNDGLLDVLATTQNLNDVCVLLRTV